MWQGFQFVWWTQWVWGYQIRCPSMQINLSRLTQLLESKSPKQDKFILNQHYNHMQEYSITLFNSPVPKCMFFPSLHTFCYPESPRTGWKAVPSVRTLVSLKLKQIYDYISWNFVVWSIPRYISWNFAGYRCIPSLCLHGFFS